VYYKPVPEKPENLKMMEIMDRHLTDHPTEGVVSLVLFLIARNYPATSPGPIVTIKEVARTTSDHSSKPESN
jgi:hypothetical protein